MQVRSARELGFVVRGRRKKLGWSQEQLAQQARVSRWWVTELESGRARAQLDLVLRTVGALGLVLDLSPEGQAPRSGVERVSTVDLDELIRQHHGAEAEV